MHEALVNTMPFAASLDIEVTHADAKSVEGRLFIKDELCTIGNSVHGGALMAFADSLGAIAAFMNLPEGAAGTTTIESKTNFLRPAPAGTSLTAKTVPVSVGKKVCVLTTTISSAEGKPVAVVTQTQMVL